MNTACTGTPRLDGRCAVAGCHTAATWWRHRESPWRIHAHRASNNHSRYPGPRRGRIEFGRFGIGDGKRAREFCSCAGARLRLALRLLAQHHALVAGERCPTAGARLHRRSLRSAAFAAGSSGRPADAAWTGFPRHVPCDRSSSFRCHPLLPPGPARPERPRPSGCAGSHGEMQ